MSLFELYIVGEIKMNKYNGWANYETYMASTFIDFYYLWGTIF